MIKDTDSTVFNVGADCIVNTINCVGFMGKGLALEFALRFPELEQDYVEACKKKVIHTGQVYFHEIDGQKIINFPTKFHFKYPSKMEWIEQGLDYFLAHYKAWGIQSVAFPLLGAGNGGLDPKVVEQTMRERLALADIDVYICHSKLLEGKELEMVAAFQSASIMDLKKQIRLNAKQCAALQQGQTTIRRFVDISKLEGIGTETYKALFQLFYREKKQSYEQLSLFPDPSLAS